MNPHSLRIIGLAILAAAVLPLRADGVSCFNPTTSYASTARNPTQGDEKFFTLPAGPANVMFVLDSSGSMIALPPCGDSMRGWGHDARIPGMAACSNPALPALPTTNVNATVGTCDVASDPQLRWMGEVTPQTGYADPGHGATANALGLLDHPTWGNGCTGNDCLFNPTGAYMHGRWTESSATQFEDCTAYDGNLDVITDASRNRVTADLTQCRNCLATKGFYFFRTRYQSGSGWTNTAMQHRFSGAWLNAYPPKVVSARKVIKDLVWMDDAVDAATDKVRFGLSRIEGGGEILVPLGPNKPDSYTLPFDREKFVPARQLLLDVLNRRAPSGSPVSFADGSTPLATSLFRVGQYFTSSSRYTDWFGSTYERDAFKEGVAGTAAATWADANQCSVCWGCQTNSIILVTDGSPNNEGSLPSKLDNYDDSAYTQPSNCGPGDCWGGEACTNTLASPVYPTPATAGSVGTIGGHPTFSCNTNPDRCRCYNNRSAPHIPAADYCYTCPGSTTPREPGYPCYYACPGDSTRRAADYVCSYACDGDPTPRAADYVCGCFCGSDRSVSYAAGATCPASMCCSPTASWYRTLLPRIASWLHNNDLRTDLQANDPQVINTYTVSFGLLEPEAPAVNPAVQILKATAAMGGGFFSNAKDRSSLADAVARAVSAVTERSTAFGAPAAASLSTLRTAAVEAVLTRFLPHFDDPTWEGHVFQAQLFDEFLNGCNPLLAAAQQPRVVCARRSLSADFNGDGKCNGVFLLDADCDEVEEDTSGQFYKKGVLGTSGTCSTTTATTCNTSTTPTGCPSGETCNARGAVSANMFWDAGVALSYPSYPTGHPRAGQAVPGYKAANARNILSVLGAGATNTLTPFNADHAADWAPYLNLDSAWCTARLQTWRICGTSPLPDCSTVAGGIINRCAQGVIDFVHGWDVTDMDGDGCAGPGAYGNTAACPDGADGEERNRPNDRRSSPTFWKLGDTFHSSPVMVRPPMDVARCSTGLENQCTPTVFSPASFAHPTSMTSNNEALDGTSTASAYEAYRLSRRTRRQVVLVGANDGMLHAFDAGAADTSATADANGTYPYGHGNGSELWAFIPPDLLPRLKDLTTSHQYMVDGAIMVKDVWVDGSTSDPTDFNDSNTIDNVKQHESGKEEFHTVAVVTERTGGTQYTGLDITDVENPKFLWNFPPPGSDDARYMGQSWSDFAPGPPPIGPFRFSLRSGVPDPTTRGFEERWAVAVNGGYDPTLARGRAVWLIDVWTGGVLWRFTDDDFKTNMEYSSSTGMLPVVGSMSGADIGDFPTFERDGFYDTLVWADMGGSVFVGRVSRKGTLGTDGRVTDWYAARTFEQQRQAGESNAMSATLRTPFFYMPDVTFDATSGTLRAYLGSGNRERIMAESSECNPDNLMGCCQAGCSVTRARITDTFGACSTEANFSCASGVLSVPATTNTCATVPACGTAFTGEASVKIECSGQTAIDVTSSTTCTDSVGDGTYTCSTPPGLGKAEAVDLPDPTGKSRFYGIWAFGGSSAKSFSTLAESRTFEANRFTDVARSGCTGPAGGACGLVNVTSATVSYNASSPSITSASVQASDTSAGWYYEYGSNCPLASSCSESNWVDEKTGAGASVMVGCVAWGSFRPTTAGGSLNPCTEVPLPQSYAYLADYLTGTPSATCGYQDSANTRYVRATQRTTFATPSVQTVRVVLSPTGEVKYQGLEFPPGGSGGMVSETTFGTRSDVAETMYWMEVPRDLHNCRHVASLAASVCD